MSKFASFEQILLELTTLDDFCIGTGLGDADLDETCVTDQQGFPMVPKTHIQGLLREAFKYSARYQASADQQANRQKALEKLLGKEGSEAGTLLLSSFYCVEPERLATDCFVTHSFSALEEDGFTAAQKMQRSIQFGNAGLRFHAYAQFTDKAQKEFFQSLLKRVGRIGSDRKNGGRVHIKVSQPAQQAQRQSQTEPLAGATQLRIQLRNLDALALQLDTSPKNFHESRSFIPARTLKSALLNEVYSHLADDKEPIAEDKEHIVALLNRISFGDALPLPAELAAKQVRVLPLPLSLIEQKRVQDAEHIPSWIPAELLNATTSSRYVCELSTKDLQKKDYHAVPDGHYLVFAEGQSQLFQPDMVLRTRNDVANQNLFSGQLISENTIFQSELLFNNDEDLLLFHKVFADYLQRGRWLGIGRGRVPVSIERITYASHDASMLQEQGNRLQPSQFVLMLSTNTIVLNHDLRFKSTLTIDDLCELVGMRKQTDWQIVRSCFATELVGGINAYTRQPDFADLAIKRGSCCLVEGTDIHLLMQKLAKQKAIGERTLEGFGRIAVLPADWSQSVKMFIRSTPQHQLQEHALTIQQLAKQSWAELVKNTTSDNTRMLSQLTTTKLQQLREVIANVQNEDMLQAQSLLQALGTATSKAFELLVPNLCDQLKGCPALTSLQDKKQWFDAILVRLLREGVSPHGNS